MLALVLVLVLVGVEVLRKMEQIKHLDVLTVVAENVHIVPRHAVDAKVGAAVLVVTTSVLLVVPILLQGMFTVVLRAAQVVAKDVKAVQMIVVVLVTNCVMEPVAGRLVEEIVLGIAQAAVLLDVIADVRARTMESVVMLDALDVHLDVLVAVMDGVI